MFTSEVKPFRGGAGGKPSVNSATVCGHRPETGCSSHEQVEVEVKFNGGPNRERFKTLRMTCG